MNMMQAQEPAGLAARRFVLATDLDGTFLGGPQQARDRLYGWIEQNRESVGLVFVTGRDPGFIGELCASGVPWPDYVVGDVGTTIAEVRHPEIVPIDALEAEIAARWADAGPRVRAALADHPGLRLQPTEFRHRVSYDLDPARFDDSAVGIVERMGLDVLISDNRFFDVLPRGVSKGPSIRRLIAHLGVDPGSVLVAGDTLNDLSMLECGLPAVAVGGSEPELVARVGGLAHVHMADGHGAAGILEAIAVHGMHELNETTGA